MKNACLKDRIVVSIALLVAVALTSTWMIQTANSEKEDASDHIIVENEDHTSSSTSSTSFGARTSLLSQQLEDGEEEARDLIVGGKEASPGDFPYYGEF